MTTLIDQTAAWCWSADALLDHLRERGVRVSLAPGGRIVAPRNVVLTPSEHAAVIRHKAPLVRLLEAEAAAAPMVVLA